MTQYATTSDLGNLGLPSAALVNVSSTVQDAHLRAQGDRIDTYLRAHHTLPLTAPYPREVVEANSVMAGYSILSSYRGFDPAGADENFRLRYEDAIAWLRDLAAGRAHLDEAADTTPATSEGRPRVWTGGTNRAWGTGDTGASRGW